VLLHEQDARTRPVHRDTVDAMADLGIRVGNVFRLEPTVDRTPGLAGVVGPEGARSRNRDVDASGIARIEKDRVQAHPTGARLPVGPCAVAAQSGEFPPRLAAVGRAKQGGVFYAGVDSIRIGQRWFEMPDSLEFPGAKLAVVPLVLRERLPGFRGSVVDELVALALGHAVGSRGRLARRCPRLVPCLAAVI